MSPALCGIGAYHVGLSIVQGSDQGGDGFRARPGRVAPDSLRQWSVHGLPRIVQGNEQSSDDLRGGLAELCQAPCGLGAYTGLRIVQGGN